jgi:hypothetical protein
MRCVVKGRICTAAGKEVAITNRAIGQLPKGSQIYMTRQSSARWWRTIAIPLFQTKKSIENARRRYLFLRPSSISQQW